MKNPKHWLSIPMEKLVIAQKGKKPVRLSNKQFRDSIPYLDIEALEKNNTTHFADPYSTVISHENDILVVWDGSRSGLAFKAKKGAVASTLMCLTPVGVNSAFLFFFLKSKFNILNDNLIGGSIPHVNSEQFYELKIPYPPISEQKEIVSKIENSLIKFESDIELSTKTFHLNLNNHLAEVNPSLNKNKSIKFYSLIDFVNSILDFAFSGELIGVVKNSSEKFRQVKLKSVLSDISYGTSKPLTNEKNGIPIIRIPNLKDFYINTSDLKYTKLTEDEHKKIKLSTDDILLIRSNGSINLLGRSGIVSKKEENFAFAGYLLRLKPNKKLINPKFLNFILHAPQVRLQIESIQKSSSGVNNINAKEVGDLTIALPSLDQQKKIVTAIVQLLKKVKDEQQQIEQQNVKFETLQKSLLQSMFIESSTKSIQNDSELSSVIVNLEVLKKSKIVEIKKFKKEQAKFYNSNFSNTKDLAIVRKHIVDYTLQNLSKKSLLTETDVQNIREETQAIFTEVDYDDFSSIFLELIQERINGEEPAPFFKVEHIDGKVHYKINLP